MCKYIHNRYITLFSSKLQTIWQISAIRCGTWLKMLLKEKHTDCYCSYFYYEDIRTKKNNLKICSREKYTEINFVKFSHVKFYRTI